MALTTLLPLLLAAALPQAAVPPVALPGPVDLVEVEVPSPRHLVRLHALATDIEPHQPQRGAPFVRILSDDAEQERLRAAGFRLRVLQEDLTAFYAARAASDLPAGAIGLGSGGGSMGGYRTLAEIELDLIQLAVTHASRVSLPFSIGTTHEGRNIRAFRISTSPTLNDPTTPTVWFDALHHAREPMGAEAVLRFAEELASEYGSDPEITRLVETRDFLFIPCVNPDGYEFNRELAPGGGGSWRKNKRLNSSGTIGVDLNRNYDWQWGPGWLGSSSTTGSFDYHGPAAFSEPETQALRDLMAVELPAVAVSAHAWADAWIFPWGYDALLTVDDAVFREYAALAAEPVGWGHGAVWEELYFANGSSLDWMYGTHGCLAFAVEIGDAVDGYWPTPSRMDELYAKAREGFLVASRVAGAWVEVRGESWTEVSGDGDAHREAGETWDLSVELENIGLGPATGDLALASSWPELTPQPGLLPFSLASRATQVIGPLRLDIAPSVVNGQPYELGLDVTWEGRTDRFPLELVLGEPHQLILDGMQFADYGWSVDLAGPGAWERAVPTATSAQPGSDRSGLAAGKCWVTGAKGGPADSNDVDGVTRLVSPIFRAGHLAHLELQYARWFAGLGGAGAGDALEVEVSDDAGVSWTTLELVSSSSGWELPTFDLEDHVTLTELMRLRFTVRDVGGDDTVECLLDDLSLRAVGILPSLGLWGETSLGEPMRLFLDHPPSPNGNYRLLWSLTVGAGTATPGIDGRRFLSGTVRTLLTGTGDALGRAEIPTRIPNLPALKNVTVHMQILADEGGAQPAYSNLLSFTIR